ncbi:hypothetical protein ACFY5C_10325 [Streptomyces sp. NPDC012935]|uniref:hypothetical protein n=1 Tax=Streptomyces sp. NPDC012935 TaxID=3364857 RepID=UPI0036B589E2
MRPRGRRRRDARRHPVVATAMALTCGIPLTVGFGAWEDIAARAAALAAALGW